MNTEYKAAVKIANEYRAESGTAGGAVIIYNNEVAGWQDELRDPQHWVPGCLAIVGEDLVFIAMDGNDDEGAKNWEAVAIEHQHNEKTKGEL